MAQALRATFSDPAFRYGLKFGLAGVLAVFLALLIRLKEPTWALFTVFVLMIAQFFGAIAEKSVFRVAGTLVGGVLGYLLTASFEQQPLVFLSLIAVVVGFCTAMFGQNRYPYAFLLCGMTMTVVISNGLGNPDFSWQYALWRIEEVSLGVIVALIVQSLLWPRFARIEFIESVHAAFGDLTACFRDGAESVFRGGDPEAVERAEDFPARIALLRSLLEFGARESRYFRARLPTYFELTTCLSRISAAIATLSKAPPSGSYYQSKVRADYAGVLAALEAALADLADRKSDAGTRASKRDALRAAISVLEKRLLELRGDPALFEVTVEDATAFALHSLVVYDIRDQVQRAHELLDSLPTEMGDFRPSAEKEPVVSPIPSPFWIHAGIKAAIALALALVIDNWLNPPGGSMFVLGAWVLTTLNAASPGGRGDGRAFHIVVYATLVIGATSLVLLAIRPMLSSYAVMNTIIFVWLFVWGYTSFRVRGVTIPMQLAMLMIVGILGLNGQEPISFQQIVDYFFGLVLALVLSSVIQRLIWPSLPQWELRNRIVELLALTSRLLEEGPSSLPLWQKTRIALIPGEAATRIARLDSPVVPDGERQLIGRYLSMIRRVGAEFYVSPDRLLPLLPPGHPADFLVRLRELEDELRKHLAAHKEALLEARPPGIDPEPLRKLLAAWGETVFATRAWLLRRDWPILDTIRIIGLAARYSEAGRAILESHEAAHRLRLSLYMGDYSL